MERLVRFRSMADGLSPPEFDTMLLSMHRILGRDVLLKALFHYFAQQNEDNEYYLNMQHTDDIDEANGILTDIIYNRKHSKLSFESTTPPRKRAKYTHTARECKTKSLRSSAITMNSLPSALIACTASYLCLADYSEFERVNRFIFTSCRSDGYSLPIQAIEYDDSITKNNQYMFWIHRYYKHCELYAHKMSLKRFENLEQISLDLAYLPSIVHGVQTSTNAVALWNNVQTLKLYSFHNWVQRADLRAFVHSNYCNFSRVKHLILSDFGCNSSDRNDIESYTATFLSLLCHRQLVNVQQLQLLSVSNTCLDLRLLDAHLFDLVYPNLRALHYEADSKIGQLMANLYGSQLQSLHINDNVTSREWFCTCSRRNQYSGQCEQCGAPCLYLQNLKQIRFHRLTELCLYNQIDDIMFHCITQSVLHLKRLHVSFHHKSLHTYNAIKTMLQSVLTQHNELEYISLETDSLTPIVEVLQNTQKLDVFDTLKMKVVMVEEIYEGELKSSLIAMKRRLQEMVKRDWMILLRADIETKNRIDDHLEIQQCIQQVKYGQHYDDEILSMQEEEGESVPDCMVSCHVQWQYQYHTVSMAISSADCRMNGYQEHWLMHCQKCTTHDFIPCNNVH